jgi:hypothetical protein
MDLYAVFRGDMTTRANYFSKMMQSAAITPNQIRVKEGMAPYTGGDRYFVAVNNYSPADRIDEIIDAQVAPKPTSPVNPSGGVDSSKPKNELEEAAISYLKRK